MKVLLTGFEPWHVSSHAHTDSPVDRQRGHMRHSRQLCYCMALLLCTTMVLTSCTYETAIRRLSPTEQAEFRLYQHVMTSAQVRTYLAQATATERTAYLNKTGLVQRLQALDPLDRDAVRSGFPRQGISAEALRFIWGEPSYTDGWAHHYEHWHYVGSSMELAASGNQPGWFGNRVEVSLVDDHVVGWVDVIPTTSDGSNDCMGC
jgi:hypothetical protein